VDGITKKRARVNVDHGFRQFICFGDPTAAGGSAAFSPTITCRLDSLSARMTEQSKCQSQISSRDLSN